MIALLREKGIEIIVLIVEEEEITTIGKEIITDEKEIITEEEKEITIAEEEETITPTFFGT